MLLCHLQRLMRSCTPSYPTPCTFLCVLGPAYLTNCLGKLESRICQGQMWSRQDREHVTGILLRTLVTTAQRVVDLLSEPGWGTEMPSSENETIKQRNKPKVSDLCSGNQEALIIANVYSTNFLTCYSYYCHLKGQTSKKRWKEPCSIQTIHFAWKCPALQYTTHYNTDRLLTWIASLWVHSQFSVGQSSRNWQSLCCLEQTVNKSCKKPDQLYPNIQLWNTHTNSSPWVFSSGQLPNTLQYLPVQIPAPSIY